MTTTTTAQQGLPQRRYWAGKTQQLWRSQADRSAVERVLEKSSALDLVSRTTLIDDKISDRHYIKMAGLRTGFGSKKVTEDVGGLIGWGSGVRKQNELPTGGNIIQYRD